MNQDYQGLFEDWEVGLAKNVINNLLKQWMCLEKEGFDDLLQECLTHWHFTKGKYNPNSRASIKTFMAKVLRNKILNIIERYDSDKRRLSTKSLSLSLPLSSEDGSGALQETIPAQDIRIQAELRIDIAKACQKLTPHQRRLCALLFETGLNIKEISEKLGVNRKRVYKDIERIRIVFEDEGLENYFI